MPTSSTDSHTVIHLSHDRRYKRYARRTYLSAGGGIDLERFACHDDHRSPQDCHAGARARRRSNSLHAPRALSLCAMSGRQRR